MDVVGQCPRGRGVHCPQKKILLEKVPCVMVDVIWRTEMKLTGPSEDRLGEHVWKDS
jgi:hypothetical protein